MDYDVTIVPDTYSTFNGSTSIQMTLSYNIKYNVTVRATLCGENSAQTQRVLEYGQFYNILMLLHCLIIIFKYSFVYIVKCIDPLNSDPGLSMIGESVIVSNYRNPAFEGAIINFTCDSGLTLVGPNSSVCLSNGLWEPDPREVECRGTDY